MVENWQPCWCTVVVHITVNPNPRPFGMSDFKLNTHTLKPRKKCPDRRDVLISATLNNIKWPKPLS